MKRVQPEVLVDRILTSLVKIVHARDIPALVGLAGSCCVLVDCCLWVDARVVDDL